jgi:hypothetical protein
MPTLPDAANESESERDGFLSYSGEWHAVAVGAFFGFVFAATGTPAVSVFAFLVFSGKAKASNNHLRDAAKEVAYSGGAFVVFAVVGGLVV